MGEISSASSEQSSGVSQVGQAVTQMDQATQQNAALVEEMAQSIGIAEYQVLFSRKNWKRARLPLLQEQEDGVL